MIFADIETTIMVFTNILSFVAGGGGIFFLNFLKQRSETKLAIDKQQNDIKQAEIDKAFAIYKELITSLRADIEGLMKGMHDIDNQLISTREEKVAINTKLEISNSNLQTATLTIQTLQKELDEIKSKKAIDGDGTDGRIKV